LDAYLGKDLNLWNISTGVLLVKESGGKVTKLNGNPWDISSKEILASNSNLHEIIQNILI